MWMGFKSKTKVKRTHKDTWKEESVERGERSSAVKETNEYVFVCMCMYVCVDVVCVTMQHQLHPSGKSCIDRCRQQGA